RTVSRREPSGAMTLGSRSATPCERSVRRKSTGSPPAPRSSIVAPQAMVGSYPCHWLDFPTGKVYAHFPTRKGKPMESPITPADARSALAQVDRARRAVIDEVDIPQWYWWALAIGWIALGVITDTAPSWVTSAATLAFGAAHSAVAPR